MIEYRKQHVPDYLIQKKINTYGEIGKVIPIILQEYFSTKTFPEQKQMTKEDYIIICGDFGYWDESMKQEEEIRQGCELCKY